MIAWGPFPDAHRDPPARQSPPVQRLPLIGQSFAHSAVEAVQRAAFESVGLEIEIEPWSEEEATRWWRTHQPA